MGFSPQVPVHRAAERDEDKIARWREEPVWPDLKRSLANLTKRDIDQLTALIKTRLRQMQYRPALLDGFLAKTRLGNPAAEDRYSRCPGAR